MTSLIYCQAAKHLLEDFAASVRELVKLHEEQFQSILAGDVDSTRFDDLIAMAIEQKHAAKYAYLQHLETHGCTRINGTNQD